MTPQTHDLRSDRVTLIYRHYERLYRLAMLVAGNTATATALVQSAFRQLPAETEIAADTETQLIRALLDQRPLRRSRWKLALPDITYITLDRAQVTALLRLLAARSPAERLVVGLAYINGSAPSEIAALIGGALGKQTPAEVLELFRVGAARALGLVPPHADQAMLGRLDRLASGELADEAALELRRDLIAQPELRELRDGMLAARELLPRSIPALFAVAPPPALVGKLLELVQNGRAPRLPQISARRAQVLLAVAVLGLAAAIILLPSLANRLNAPAAARTQTIPQLLDSAIHRFDRAPLQSGVVHEQYRIDSGQRGAYLVERWYDYAAPNRLAIDVSREGRDGAKGQPLLQVASNGQNIVQLRYNRNRRFGEQSADVQISPAEARQLIPLLRGMPRSTPDTRFEEGPNDPSSLFLAQARASNTTSLGQVTILGRPAFLLTYETSQPPLEATPSAGQPVRVLLTIDADTKTLLDIAVVPAGEAESTASHPLRAQQFEVLAQAPDTQFTLPSGPDVEQRFGMSSVHFPFIESSAILSIDDAAQQNPNRLLAPLQLPDAHMRALAIRNGRGDAGDDIVLLYEGEFQNVIVLQNFAPGANQALGEEQTAGVYRYRLLNGANDGEGLVAMVYRPEAPDQPFGLILNDDIATPTERQATLQALIASLTPIDDQSLPVLRQNFQSPSPAAGGI
jgi:DNA-directed RNA polymerase specialized sigma24 family protein